MKKPESSVKRRKASNARGKKRSDRAKATQQNKLLRGQTIKNKKKNDDRKLKQYMDSLLGKM